MELGYTHAAKILKVFDSCKTYEQWNITWDWYKAVNSRFTPEVREMLIYKLDYLFNGKNLGHRNNQ